MEYKLKREKTRILVKKYRWYMMLGIVFAALLLLLPACQDNQSEINNPTAGGSDNIQAGFYTEGAGDNSIQFTEIKFVLRKMTLEYEHSENECDVKMGPFVVPLDLGMKLSVAGIAKIPFGTYDAVKFQVHKPSPNDGITDPDFFDGNRRYSVVVKGVYNNVPFIYKSDVTVSKKIDFEIHPITVSAPSMVYFTISVNPYTWFLENGVFIDPTIESNHHWIDENIKYSLKRAFRDMNQDGYPD